MSIIASVCMADVMLEYSRIRADQAGAGAGAGAARGARSMSFPTPMQTSSQPYIDASLMEVRTTEAPASVRPRHTLKSLGLIEDMKLSRSLCPSTNGSSHGTPTAFFFHFLVVDDVASNRAILSRILLGMGHSVVEATDGEEAVQKCKESMAALNMDWTGNSIMTPAVFDCVLIDYTMPFKVRGLLSFPRDIATNFYTVICCVFLRV